MPSERWIDLQHVELFRRVYDSFVVSSMQDVTAVFDVRTSACIQFDGLGTSWVIR